jgi:hypothetical protein
MEGEILRLVEKAGPLDIKAINLEELKSGMHHDDIYNLYLEIGTLSTLKMKTEAFIKAIDKILDDASKERECRYYGYVLRKWYIEREKKEVIAKEIGYATRTSIYDIKSRAIRKVAIMMYGVGALNQQ